MIWDDKLVEQMVELRNSGLTIKRIGEKMGASSSCISRKLKRVRVGITAHKDGGDTRKLTNILGVSPREVTETYKAFNVTNTTTGIRFRVSGVGHELPHRTLKSTVLGEVRKIKKKKVVTMVLEYERIL
jgi:hypothetical protein